MANLRVLHRQLPLPYPAHEVFAWHLRPGALERLIPPWSGVRVAARRGGIADGGEVELALPFGRRWLARHEGFVAGREFRDRQISGPFAEWLHVHRVLPADDGCLLEDQIEYALPGGALGRALGQPLIERHIARTWRHRDRRIRDDLDRHAAWAGRAALRVAVSGASGLLGGELAAFLGVGGHTVVRLVRRAAGAGDIAWDPGRGVDAEALEGVDAVVHLAGRNVGTRWTPAVRAEIRASRVEPTRHLCEALARLRRPPHVLVCASGVGFYGDRGDEAVKEDARSGDGFLAEVCRAWEAACAPARDAGIRVVHARLGMVVSGRGGALPRLARVARLGGAGPVGGGRQWLSWIACDDAIAALHHLLLADEVSGAVNLVSPEPVTNAGFMRTLGAVVHRPALLPLPRPAVELLFGEMGRETLLASTRALPGRLLGAAFAFRQARLVDALRRELGTD